MFCGVLLTSVLGFSSLFAPGCASGDCENGQGRYVYPSGAIYEGTFLLGHRHGKGHLVLSDGTDYRGDFRRDYREGDGLQVRPDGERYQGGFVRDRYHGQGEARYADGRTYSGHWAQGLAQGQGVLQVDGYRFEGSFSDGMPTGQGTTIDAGGHRLAGHWQGFDFIPERSPGRSGTRPPAPAVRPTFRYADGSLFDGTMENGRPEGEGTCRYSNGDRYTGGWSHHSPHGEGTLWTEDGRTITGEWSYGRLVRLDAPIQPVNRLEVHPLRDPAVRIWALVAGIGPYDHLADLEFPDDDARRFRDFLQSPGGGSVPDAQIRLLVNGEATRDRLLAAMQEIFGLADENDVVLVYFSGHGLDGALVPADFDGFNNRIFNAELLPLMEASLARQKIVIADACHAGSLLTARGTTPESSLEAALGKASRGSAFLLSSGQDQVSLEDRKLASGVFSHFLRLGLDGRADADGDGWVRFGELFRFVRSGVTDRTSGRQTPVMWGTCDEDLPLAYHQPSR